MAKTPARVIELINRHTDQMVSISEILRVKRTVPIENQASHVHKSEDYWIGVAHGYSSMLEAALHEHKCYAGYRAIASKKEVLPDGNTYFKWITRTDPDYADWRVQYFIK